MIPLYTKERCDRKWQIRTGSRIGFASWLGLAASRRAFRRTVAGHGLMKGDLELVQKLLPGFRPRLDGIVPIGARFVSMDIELFHFLVGHFDFLLIDASVTSRCHAQAAFIGGASNGMKHQIQAA